MWEDILFPGSLFSCIDLLNIKKLLASAASQVFHWQWARKQYTKLRRRGCSSMFFALKNKKSSNAAKVKLKIRLQSRKNKNKKQRKTLQNTAFFPLFLLHCFNGAKRYPMTDSTFPHNSPPPLLTTTAFPTRESHPGTDPTCKQGKREVSRERSKTALPLLFYHASAFQ